MIKDALTKNILFYFYGLEVIAQSKSRLPFIIIKLENLLYIFQNSKLFNLIILFYKWTGHRAWRPLCLRCLIMWSRSCDQGHVIGSCDWVRKKGGASKPISLLVRRASKVLIGINWFCELVWQYPVDILFVNICRLRSAKPHVTAKYPKTCSDLYKQTKTQKMLSRQK